MKSNEKIIDQIKKLLRMKRGGTAAEVESALSIALKLASKYGIDINSVDPNDESKTDPITEENISILSRIQAERKYAAMIAQRFFNVRLLLISNILELTSFSKKSAIRFIGTKSDIEIAKYVYNFLVKHFQREWNTKRGRLRNRESFMFGMYQGLYYKLYDQEPKTPATPGLVLFRDRLQKYIDEKHPNIKSKSVDPKSKADAALHRGFEAGQETNIRKAVKTDKQNSPLQLSN